MDPMDWRLSLVGRYMHAFERGDRAALERIFSPNFHEHLRDYGEASRNEALNHFDDMVRFTRYRNIQILAVDTEDDDEVRVSCTFRFHAATHDWIVDVRMNLRMADRLIEYNAIEYAKVTVLERWGEESDWLKAAPAAALTE